MTRHLDQLTQTFIDERVAIGKHMHDDMCRECADDAGTPWPEDAKAPHAGPCHWCGKSDVSLMPVAELEDMEAS
jgi:hypothetical protein